MLSTCQRFFSLPPLCKAPVSQKHLPKRRRGQASLHCSQTAANSKAQPTHHTIQIVPTWFWYAPDGCHPQYVQAQPIVSAQLLVNFPQNWMSPLPLLMPLKICIICPHRVKAGSHISVLSVIGCAATVCNHLQREGRRLLEVALEHLQSTYNQTGALTVKIKSMHFEKWSLITLLKLCHARCERTTRKKWENIRTDQKCSRANW